MSRLRLRPRLTQTVNFQICLAGLRAKTSRTLKPNPDGRDRACEEQNGRRLRDGLDIAGLDGTSATDASPEQQKNCWSTAITVSWAPKLSARGSVVGNSSELNVPAGK